MLKKPSFVLDCSVTMAWCFEDESTDYTDAVLSSVTEQVAIVPALWCLEVANTLVLAQRKKRLSPAKATTFIEHLNLLLIETDDVLLYKPMMTIVEIGKQTALTAYDAVYLELAIRKGLPLATLDLELKKAARQVGVEIF